MGWGSNKSGHSAIGLVALIAAGIAGVAASAYGVATAYFMGSRAQASVDNSTPAPPASLLAASMEELRNMVGAQAPHGPIPADVVVTDTASLEGETGTVE